MRRKAAPTTASASGYEDQGARVLGGMSLGIALFAAPLVVLQDHSDSPLGLFYFFALVVGAAWIVATGVAMLRLREEPVDAPVGARA